MAVQSYGKISNNHSLLISFKYTFYTLILCNIQVVNKMIERFTFYTLLKKCYVLGRLASKSDVLVELKIFWAALLRAFEIFCSEVPKSIAISVVLKPSRDNMHTLYWSLGSFFSMVIK